MKYPTPNLSHSQAMEHESSNNQFVIPVQDTKCPAGIQAVEHTFSNKSRIFAEWQKELKSLEQQQQNRILRPHKGLDFSSNDYLSLSQQSHIRKSLIQALKGSPRVAGDKGSAMSYRSLTCTKTSRYFQLEAGSARGVGSAIEADPARGVGSAIEADPARGARLPLPLSAGGSRLLRGHTFYHEEIESLFQKWIGRESALFFASGYMANIGIINVLPKNTVLFSDQFNHASLIDACRLSQLTRHIYPHKDMNHLESLLKKEKGRNKVIITESLFSMGGDLAPLEDISSLALKYQALLIVDEAHATGLYGHKGRGLVSLLKQKEHIITIHPCGKALSVNGAFIAGPCVLKQYLINKCRTFIYTTAPSPIVVFHIKCVLQFLENNPQRKEKVKQKARFFRKLLSKPFGLEDSESAIVPIVIGSAKQALNGAQYLQKKGYDIRAIRYPTVPKGQEGLRVCIHYNHTNAQLTTLAHHLEQVKTQAINDE